MRALFLGAGASYEVGMPLVWEFSNTLRENVLKRLDSNLFNFKGDNEIKLEFISLLSDTDLHYEQVVTKLELLYLGLSTKPTKRDIVRGVIIQLIECIQLLLLEEQNLTTKFLQERIKHYYGLSKFMNQDEPTYVFSLNHDVVFEEICSYFKIAIKDGFFNTPRKYGHIAPFSSISTKQLESGKLCLFPIGTQGVNLIKLHGSLDIFGVEDMEYFLKAKGSGESVGSHIQAATDVEKHSQRISVRDQYRATNELCVEDSDGEIQFLRRSLLSGGHKFKNDISQIAPISFLNCFRDSLHYINEITVIGYSFGDEHINNILLDWVSGESRNIRIYDPFIKTTPPIFKGLESNVTIENGGFTDFCLAWDSSKESFNTKSMREALDLVRNGLKQRRTAKT